MFTLGIIEESLASMDVLDSLRPYLFSQRMEEIPGDAVPVWHTNEYHLPAEALSGFLPTLEQNVLPSWYVHAFNDDCLLVILSGKTFTVSQTRDHTWDDMIAYGESVQVERRFLENIPLRV